MFGDFFVLFFCKDFTSCSINFWAIYTISVLFIKKENLDCAVWKAVEDCEKKESHLGEKWWGVLRSPCSWTGQCRWIPQKGRDPPACWVIQFVSSGLAKQKTPNLCSSPDILLIYHWVRVSPGAVSPRRLIRLGVCVIEYVKLLACWQARKSQVTLQSLTLLQPRGEEERPAFEEISAALYQYRILSTQISFAHSCVMR